MEAIGEIVPFLNKAVRLDLKAVSLVHLLNLTGSKDGIALICKTPALFKCLLELTTDDAESISKDAVLSLVNISAEEIGASLILDELPDIVSTAYKSILDENSKISDAWTMVLSNLSRPEKLVEHVLDEFLKIEHSVEKLVTCFTRVNYNKNKGNLNYLGPLFSNLSQSPRGRAIFCNKSTILLTRILPFIHHEGSIVRRGGATGLLKNICFDTSAHDWLLSKEVDILPYILLPLAGPEEFDDEVNDSFPPELQYLGPEKKREDDPEIRKMLLESLQQLCATKKGREYLRARGTYEILRELHKYECGDDGDRPVLAACENVVDVLIRTEEEIGADDLKTLEIPDDVLNKLNLMDENIVESVM